ncbi:MAG: protein kinase domain-containing protein, partial [Anaerolineales bacterium]
MVKNPNNSQLIGNRFEICNLEKDLIGRGSMGEVYRAIDTRLGEQVAVKILDQKVVARDPGILDRFEHEGQALHQLNHPNIVRMVAAVEEDGQHYLIMEYIAGGSLYDLLQVRGALPSPTVLEITLDLADALTRAHRLGIIHRDLKPANVLLAEDGSPRLTDFGIARAINSPRLTQTGILMGTVDYLSPEAIEGQAIDERGDIWSFGVLLYELLCGKQPFEGQTVIAKLQAILNQPVSDLSQYCPDAPEALVDLVYRMLEKDRLQRIPSMRMVGVELEAIIKERGIPTPLHIGPGESRFSTVTHSTVLPRQNLPAQPTPFVGRETELTELAHLLADPDIRLLTILGAGGMGKTRLALEAGAAQLGNFQHGVFFVSLAPIDSVQAIVPTTAEVLGFSFYEGGEPRQQLLDFLREKNILLILDNFEHLLVSPDPGARDSLGLVTEILQTAPQVKILSTSRIKLNVQGEHIFHIAGMDFPDWDILEESVQSLQKDATEYGAVKLFLQGARYARPSYGFEAEDLKNISRICHMVGGMPLGILLAAAWLEMLTPTEIADQISDEISQSLDFLETDLRDVPESHRSLRAIFDYSWKLLTGQEREVFQGLSIFRGGFTRQAAQEVVGASLRELRTLVNLSLLQRDRTGRYAMHELLRRYAQDKLCASPENYTYTRDRHAAYYFAALSLWGEGLKGPEQLELLPVMRQEIDNIQAAWVWVTQEKRIKQVQGGFEGLCYFYLRTLRNQEGLKTCELGLRALEGSKAECEPETRANLLAWKSLFCLNLNDHELARKSIESSLEIMHEFDGTENNAAPLWARLFLMKAIVENYLGNRENALEYYNRAFDIYHQTGDFSGFYYLMLRVLDTGGIMTEKSYQFLSEALHFKRKSGDLFNTAYLMYMYCMVVAYHLGQPVQAADLMQEGSEIFEKLGDPLSKEMSLAIADPILATNGRYDELLEIREKKLAYARERGDRQATGIYQAEVGETLCHLGNYPAAGEHFRKALVNLRGGIPYQYAFRLCCFGELLLVQNQISESYNLFEESLNGMEIGEKWGQGRALAGLSIAAFKMGDREKARELIQLALGYHHEGHTYYFTHYSLGAYAYLISHIGDTLTGIKIYAMLEQEKFVRDSRWFIDLYRNPIYALAMKNNPDEITTCESTGKQMNLWKSLEQIIQQGS